SHHKPPGSHDPLPIQSARRSFRVHSSQSAPNRTSYHQRNEQHVNQSYDHTNVNHLSHQHCEYPVIRRSIRSEEHTSELQSRFELVCRLLLEKKTITL